MTKEQQKAARDAARNARAVAWLDLWRAEREKARKERRPMRYVAYDYQENDDAAIRDTQRGH